MVGGKCGDGKNCDPPTQQNVNKESSNESSSSVSDTKSLSESNGEKQSTSKSKCYSLKSIVISYYFHTCSM
jgi:hypothetical protein